MKHDIFTEDNNDAVYANKFGRFTIKRTSVSFCMIEDCSLEIFGFSCTRHSSLNLELKLKRVSISHSRLVIETAMGGKSSLGCSPKKTSWCRGIRRKAENVMASLRCYNNCDVNITLVMTNFFLYLIQLW